MDIELISKGIGSEIPDSIRPTFHLINTKRDSETFKWD